MVRVEKVVCRVEQVVVEKDREINVVVMMEREGGEYGEMVDREGMARWCTRRAIWW